MELPELIRRVHIRSRRVLTNQVFNRRLTARLGGREHVLCLGDSHVKVFRHVHVPGVWFHPYGLGGATASGILNPASKTRSFKEFSARLARAPRWQSVLFLLGEVDCGFVIWHRAERRGLSVEEQLAVTLDSYAQFISKTLAMGFERVIVMSAPLPTIGDSPTEWGKVAKLRATVTVARPQRTELTLRFNSELAERCARLGATFVDTTPGLLDPETGEIAARFLRANPKNHHLEDAPYAELIARELGPVLQRSGS